MVKTFCVAPLGAEMQTLVVMVLMEWTGCLLVYVYVQLELGHVTSNTLPMSASAGQCACPHCIRASTSTAVMDRMMYHHSAPPPAAADDNAQVSITTVTTASNAASAACHTNVTGTSDSARPYIIAHSLNNGCC